MEFRAIFIANPAQLSVRKEQLVIRQTEEITVPMEDITSLMLESQSITISAAALQRLTDHGVTVYFCDLPDMCRPVCPIMMGGACAAMWLACCRIVRWNDASSFAGATHHCSLERRIIVRLDDGCFVRGGDGWNSRLVTLECGISFA